MKAKKLKEVLQIIEGRLLGPGEIPQDLLVSRVCQDSRLADQADIFFAVKGEKFDGHDYLQEVLDKSCRIMVLENLELGREFALKNKGAVVIYVGDTVAALQKLAGAYLRELGPKLVAITGSVGKTSTRDMCHAILSQQYRTHKNRANFNTVVGVPLMLLEMPEDTELCVLEMGMDQFGEISQMVELAPPHIAVITNVGSQHYNTMGSIENIFKAKMEIVDQMDSSGILITGRDDKYLKADKISAILKEKCGPDIPSHRFALAEGINPGLGRIDFTVKVTETSGRPVYREAQNFKISLPGRHNAQNAALAVAVALELGMKRQDIQVGLDSVKLTDHRLQEEEVSGVRLIDDSYNAGPESMRAALDVLEDAQLAGGGRRIAVLGTMLGLGDIAKREHKALLAYAVTRADKVFALDFPCEFDDPKLELFSDRARLESRLLDELDRGDLVIFKASNAKDFASLVQEIKRKLYTRFQDGI